MAIYKKIQGRDQIVADKSIVSHEQLSGREAYGAHPISAIRKLPEKLHALKEKDEELSNRITAHDQEVDEAVKRIDEEAQQLRADLTSEVERIEGKANQIALEEDTENKGKLLFTDYNGDQISVQGGFLPDEDTLSLNENNEMILKKVHTDTDTIIGDGITSNKISAIAIKDDEGIITPKDIRDKHLEIEETISQLGSTTEAELEAIKKLNSEQVDQISDLLTRTQGMGGYLNAYAFGKNVTQDKLTQYALQDIGIEDPKEIFNGTKVKNLTNGDIWILTNTSEWTDSEGVLHEAVFSWENQGPDTVIADANNFGVHGLVTGSEEYLEASIQHDGTIFINGLDEELDSLKATDQALDKKIDDTKLDLQNQLDEAKEQINTDLENIQDNLITEIDQNIEEIQNKLNQEIVDRTEADETLQANIDLLEQYTEETYETKADAQTSHNSLTTNINQVREDAVKYVNTYIVGKAYNKHDMVLLGEYYYISLLNNNTVAPVEGSNTDNWTCISIASKKVEVTPTDEKIYLTGDIQQANKSNRSIYRPNANVYIEDGKVHDSRGQLASGIELDELYDRVIEEAVVADGTTIYRNEDKSISAIGLYDGINDITKTAESIIKATTIYVYDKAEVIS